MRVSIHTRISCRLLVEGSAPSPFLTQDFILWLRVLRTLGDRTKRCTLMTLRAAVKHGNPWWMSELDFF